MYDIILGRSQSDIKKLGTKGSVMIGKQYVEMGETSSLSNPIYLDVARAHAMLVCGKRGGGKCLSGNSEVVLDSGEIVTIKDIGDKQNKILSTNTKYKLEKVDFADFYSRKSKELTKIKLKSGKTLELTPEHPLLTINSWKPLNKLKVGDRIATPRKLPIEGKNSIGKEKAKIVGYLLAEGHLNNNFVLFSNSDEIILDDFRRQIKRFDNTLEIKKHGKFDYRIVQNNKRKIKITSRDNKGRIIDSKCDNYKSSIRNWLDEIELYGLNSYDKIIPKCIFTAPNYEVKEFLNALFSSDGSIYKHGRSYRIYLGLMSEKVIKQTSHLLLRFGIVSKFKERCIKYKKQIKKLHELKIEGEFVYSFIQKIGFTGKKEIISKKALKSQVLINHNTNTDTIPKEIWDRYNPNSSWTEIGRELKYKHPKSARESIRYSPSRNKMELIGKIDSNREIYNLSTSDIYWDEISHVEKMVGNFKVYDITVPSYNNFIANDIVVHNSYTMGSIAEGLADMDPEVSKNLAFLMLDTMGIYWSMKYPNRKDDNLLKKWNLEGKGLNVNIYIPGGFYNQYKEDGVPVDYPFYIRPNELSTEDWLNAFDLTVDNAIGIVMQRVVGSLLDKEIDFDLDDMIERINDDERSEIKDKNAAINRLETAKTWGIFSKKGTPINHLLEGGKVTVLDLSPYVAMPGGWQIKSLVLGIVSKKIFINRMLVRKREEISDIINKTQVIKQKEVENDLPMPWLVIDEAHEFLPKEGKTPASNPLMTILREGRQPGVSLILATQQPGKIHTDAITQSDIVISHRITASLDLDSLDKIFLSYESKGSKALFNSMPRVRGTAIIMDDKNERLHTMQVKPRITWHGGEDPNAIRDVKDEFDLEEL